MKPTTPTEERYIHLASSSNDLIYAWCVLQEIKKADLSPLIGSAFMFALVAYARPYQSSRGTVKHKHSLTTRFVPLEHRALHSRLLAARNQILAHSDLTVKEARVHVANTATGKYVTIIQNTNYGMEEFRHLDEILDLIQKTLESIDLCIARVEEELSPNETLGDRGDRASHR